MVRLQKRLDRPSTRKAAPSSKAAAETAAAIEGVEINSPQAARVMGQLQEQIAQLRNEVSTLRQTGTADASGAMDLGPAGYPWQYYRRADRGVEAGWIVAAPGGATPRGHRSAGAFVRYMSKGMKPLTQYGTCQPPAAYKNGGAQLVPMLQNGGAREFPASQVLAYKWHMTPPLEGVVFPEYEKVKDRVRHFACDDCDYETWMIDDDKDTGMVCFRHLRTNTEDGRHNYSRREATAILAEAEIPFSSGRYAALADDLRAVELSGNADALRASAKLQD